MRIKKALFVAGLLKSMRNRTMTKQECEEEIEKYDLKGKEGFQKGSGLKITIVSLKPVRNINAVEQYYINCYFKHEKNDDELSEPLDFILGTYDFI